MSTHEFPAVDLEGTIGDNTPEHAELRLTCLREAREQMKAADIVGRGDLIYMARVNARFVLEGTTPGLRQRTDRNEASDA